MSQKKLFYSVAQCLVLDDHPETREAIQSKFTSGEIPPEEFIWYSEESYITFLKYQNLKSR